MFTGKNREIHSSKKQKINEKSALTKIWVKSHALFS